MGTDDATCTRLSEIMSRDDEQFKDEGEKAAIVGLYALVCTTGAVANAFVLLSALKFPQLRTMRNAFILNLAISDMFLCSISAPLTLYTNVRLFWPFGDLLCRLISSAQGFNIFVSTLSLAAIGLDRVLLVLFPIACRTKSGLATATILASVWVLSAGLSFPYGVAVAALPVPGPPYNRSEFGPAMAACGLSAPAVCMERHLHPLFSSRFYSLFCFIFQYLVPLLVLSATYSRVCRTIFTKSSLAGCVDRSREREKAAKKRRTAILMTGLVLSFGLAWLPWNLYMTLANFGAITFSGTHGFIQCHLIALLSAIINPMLYGLYNENFKAAYANLLREVRASLRSSRPPPPEPPKPVGEEERLVAAEAERTRSTAVFSPTTAITPTTPTAALPTAAVLNGLSSVTV